MALEGANKIDNSTVKEIDLNRYMGRWYEIARFDHFFERGLVGCIAEYSFRDDGLIKVVNTGYKKSFDGKFKESVGKARVKDSGIPGQLEVAFFLNFYGDYYVLELAPDYSYVLVGSSSDDFLWILSRTPKMKKEDLDFLLMRAQQRGYDISKLIMVEQK
ncbi:MAG: lipocalin family protein [Bacteroidales bacterium]|jgi:lipocalin|nr:lipocalin family protein [Bacteroidales bacterium]